ncbi:hypothetical protein [Bradyrhizobium sp. AZCC 2230]|uniref:hypothetical protein n=1 Tax=Bradyrhizobium sp. AZCC 2230 TaxID=3117021 RepID=UPI002FF2F652
MEDFQVFDFFVEHVITPPGRWVLQQLGVRRPHEHELASLFTGLAFWGLTGFLVFAVVMGW